MFLLDGVSLSALVALVVCAVSFLLDYFLQLPVAVRLVLLVAIVVGGIVFVFRRVLRPWFLAVPDADLAKLLEQANPTLKESFLTAVELSRPGNEAAAYVSPNLIASVVENAEASVGTVSLRPIFRLRAVWLKLGGAAALGVLLVGVSVAQPQLASIWFRRNVLMSAQAWPTRTKIELLSPLENPTIVAVGDDLPVEARLLRGGGQRVVVESSYGGDARRVRVETMAETSGGLYRSVFANVARPFQFVVEAGDDRTAPIRVEVRLRPRIDMETIRLWCDYPEYTGWTDTPFEEPLRYGNLKVPLGTKVRYEMSSNVAIRRAFFVFEKKGETRAATDDSVAATDAVERESVEEKWPGAGASPVALADDRSFSGEFEVDGSGQYYFLFETQERFKSRRPDRFRVDAIPDRKPLVRMLAPERVTERVSAEATIDILASANDDYGIVSGEIAGVLFPPASEEGEEIHLPLAGMSTKAPETLREDGSVEASLTVEMLKLSKSDEALKPGTRFQFYASVVDSSGNVGESQIHLLDVVSHDDLMKSFNDQLMVIRDQLEEARRRQQSARSDIEVFMKTTALETVPTQEAPKLLRHRQDQQRVSLSLQRQVTELDRLLARMASNKVGDRKWMEWIRGLQAELREVAETKSPGVENDLSSLHQDAIREPQSSSRLSAVTQAQRGVERDLDALILRLTEFGDVSAVIELLRDIKRRQARVRDATRDRAGNSSDEKSDEQP